MGLLPNRRKNDIQIENSKGKVFIAPHEDVVKAFKRSPLFQVTEVELTVAQLENAERILEKQVK